MAWMYSTDYLNTGQIPVMAFDQPLFALAKYVQWSWPLSHGEDSFVVMFGGLHIEMALWRFFRLLCMDNRLM